MPVFKITFQQKVIETSELLVEAASAEEAQAMGDAIVREIDDGGSNDLGWDGCLGAEDIRVTSVEKAPKGTKADENPYAAICADEQG